MYAVLHTTQGDITISLFDELAPNTVAQFIALARGDKDYGVANARGETSGPFYDGCEIHCSMRGFLIQTGCPQGDGRGEAGFRFTGDHPPELTFDKPFRVAMANRGPTTNSCQFFITVTAMEHLTGNNPIFGEVADPMAQQVVRKINNLPTDFLSKPVPGVVIESIEIVE